MLSEQELLQQIQQAESDKKDASLRLTDVRRMLTDIETQLIEASLRYERLTEELRVVREMTVCDDECLTARNTEIERYRQVMDELLKKV